MRSRCSCGIGAFILATAIIGCGERQQQPQATVAPHADAKLLASELEDAFRTSSAEKLASFLRKWHDWVPPRDLEEINDPLERELYSVFKDFFNPFALNTIAGGEGYADVIETYERAKYIIVQNTLRFQVGETGTRTITDFRPAVTFANADVLYLTPAYREALVAFLEADNTSDGIDVDSTVERVQFLNRYVGFHIAHWSGWDLATPPTVELIQLNETNTMADVTFSVLSDGGVTAMERTGDEWQITDTGIYWIQ